MSPDIYGQCMLACQNLDRPDSMPYTMRVLPVKAITSRRCSRCPPSSATLGKPEAFKSFSGSEGKNSRSLGVEAMRHSPSHWQLSGSTKNQPAVGAAKSACGHDNQNGGDEGEVGVEGLDATLRQTEAYEAVRGRIPTIKVDQESDSRTTERTPLAPLAGNRPDAHSSSSIAKPSVSTSNPPAEGLTSPQEGRRSAASRTSSVTPGHAAARWTRPWGSEFVFLSFALLFIAPVSGGFDRGGFQHQITWGRGNSPPGSAVFGNSPTNVTAVVGHRARLPCQVKNLGLKDVSWIRQRDLHILTVGIFTYTSDDRFKVFHPHETEDWFLDISSVTFRDSGIYECQVSTSPKVSLPIYLTVLGMQEADIPGPDEVFIQHGSTISLQCEVQAGVEAVGPVHWFKGADTLNYSSPRGGISMEVEKTPTKTMSKLYITRAVRADSGNYTCAPLFAKPDSVLVHVVNAGEESAAAVHSGTGYCEAEESILIWAAALLPISWLFLSLSSIGP